MQMLLASKIIQTPKKEMTKTNFDFQKSKNTISHVKRFVGYIMLYCPLFWGEHGLIFNF